jgi:hypothetical protein
MVKFQEVGDKIEVAHGRLQVAEMALDEGKSAPAVAAAQAAEAVFEEAHAGRYAAEAKLILARALLAEGQLDDARRTVEQVLAVAKASHNSQLELAGSITQAMTESSSGRSNDMSEAWTRLNRLVTEACTAGFSELALEARLALGQLELRRGKLSAGRTRLEALKRAAGQDGVVLISLQAAAALRSIEQAQN